MYTVQAKSNVSIKNSLSNLTHNSIELNEQPKPPSTTTTSRLFQRTLVILQKVPKTGTTSLRDHFSAKKKSSMNFTFCFQGINGFLNETDIGDFSRFHKCPCHTNLLLSHLTQYPQYMRHILGNCDLSETRVLSVIPVRKDRIHSELQYGALFLKLDPSKSVFQNKYGYRFNPYETYRHNVYQTETCLYNFVENSATLSLPHSNPTNKKKNHFECLTDECRESVDSILRQEALQLTRLEEEFPICDSNELMGLLRLAPVEGQIHHK